MPRIRRWFPVSHDINNDPEVWIMRERIGERALSVWLELLSIADRNEGFLLARTTRPEDLERAIDVLQKSVANRCRVSRGTMASVWRFIHQQLWVVSSPIPRVVKYAEYHRTREPNKIPSVALIGRRDVNSPPPSPLPTFFTEEKKAPAPLFFVRPSHPTSEPPPEPPSGAPSVPLDKHPPAAPPPPPRKAAHWEEADLWLLDF